MTQRCLCELQTCTAYPAHPWSDQFSELSLRAQRAQRSELSLRAQRAQRSVSVLSLRACAGMETPTMPRSQAGRRC